MQGASPKFCLKTVQNIDIRTLVKYYHQLVSYKRLIGYSLKERKKIAKYTPKH
jgi:hypothetical protein